MHNKLKKGLTILCVAASLAGCREHSAIEMAFDNYVTISDDIPALEISDKEELDLGGIGHTDITIKDSLLFVTTINADGYVEIYSLPEMTYFGKYILQGNGPMECAFGFNTSMMSFVRKDSSLHSYFRDWKGYVLDWDIKKSMDTRENQVVRSGLPVPANCLSFTVMDDSTYMYRCLMDGEAKKPRFLVKSGETRANQFMDILNEATNPVYDGASFNVLSSYTCLNHDNNIVVEANFLLNYANVYRIDGEDFCRTIKIGDRLDSIDELCYKNVAALDDTMLDLKAFNDYFAVMYKPRKFAKGAALSLRLRRGHSVQVQHPDKSSIQSSICPKLRKLRQFPSQFWTQNNSTPALNRHPFWHRRSYQTMVRKSQQRKHICREIYDAILFLQILGMDDIWGRKHCAILVDELIQRRQKVSMSPR